MLNQEKLSSDILKQIAAAAELLNAGGVVAFPTETVYGLGADATNLAAVRRVYDIKQRPAHHPLIVHIGNIAQLEDWSLEIPESAWLLAKQFWPGSLTLILKRSSKIPDEVTGGQDTVGIRVPAHPVAQTLLGMIGPDKAIAAPSANLYGKISPTTAAHVHTALHEKVDMILDGGDCEVGLESTIVAFDHEDVSVLRPGGITVSAIEAAINRPVAIKKNTSAIRAPGMLPAHYAPTTPLQLHHATTLLRTAQELANLDFRAVVITWSEINTSELSSPNIEHVRMSQDPVNYGKNLYATLHQYDRASCDYILVETPPAQPAWLAVIDRLQRASQSHK